MRSPPSSLQLSRVILSSLSSLRNHHHLFVYLSSRSYSSSSVARRGRGNGFVPIASSTLPLESADPELHRLIEKEKQRQVLRIDLTASHNFTTLAVNEAFGSRPLANKCSEGIPGHRYESGNEIIDEIETLCAYRALQAFWLDPAAWGVNVQPHSGSQALFAACNALLGANDRIMGLDLSSGGHISRGLMFYCTHPFRLDDSFFNDDDDKVSPPTSTFFRSLSYRVNPDTGYIDFDELETKAMNFRPKVILCGGCLYPRDWDYARFREVADMCGAMLLCDMSSISGLVAAQEATSPFEHCDIVITETHSSLRGPRSGMVFYRKGPKPSKKGRQNHEKVSTPILLHLQDGPRVPWHFVINGSVRKPHKKCWVTDMIYDHIVPQNTNDEVYEFERKINSAVFPSLQGSPHNHQIASLAVALQQALLPAFKDYAKQVKANAVAIASHLMGKGYKIVTGGTDNHLVLWDLRPILCSGGECMIEVCKMCNIAVSEIVLQRDGMRTGITNVNHYGEDAGLLATSTYKNLGGSTANGLSLSTNAMTSRGLVEKDFEQIAEFLHQAVTIATQIQGANKSVLPHFSIHPMNQDIECLTESVKKFMGSLDLMGFKCLL